MLNLFFPFLNFGSQTAPKAETSPADSRGGPEMNISERSDDLGCAAPEEHARAPRRKNERSSTKKAETPADQAGTGQAISGQRRTKRPKKVEAEQLRPPGSTGPDVEKTPQDPVRVEAARPAPMRVERGGRTGKWGTTVHGRTVAASSLPAGQRWKRRLPPASRG